MHLIGNVLFLHVFGPNIEDRLGRYWFLLLYLAGGVASGALQVFWAGTGVIGASGAIAGCTGAFLILFPRTHVNVLSLLFVIGALRVPAWVFIGLGIAWDLFAQSMGRLGPSSGVAHLAHLGGYAYGAAIAFVLLWLKIIPREHYDLFSIGRQAYRRQQIKQAAGGAEKNRAHRAAKVQNDPAEAAQVEALAKARAEVSRQIASGDLTGAALAYRALAEAHAHVPGATLLSRKHQYDLGSHLYAAGDHNAAAYTFERFLEGYPRDPEAPQIKLLLGLIAARSMNDPIRAKKLIGEALPDLDEAASAIARRELESLG